MFSYLHAGPISKAELTQAYEILKEFACQWREIGRGLGFTADELDIIQSRPPLYATGPLSFLDAMLSDWKQWAPKDHRESTSYATLYSLRTAVSKAGLGRTAEKLDKLKARH